MKEVSGEGSQQPHVKCRGLKEQGNEGDHQILSKTTKMKEIAKKME